MLESYKILVRKIIDLRFLFGGNFFAEDFRFQCESGWYVAMRDDHSPSLANIS